ncbi:hypothetical protein JXC34_04470 [Candidatus Woesearchaeota archaeon]|nr:hypothetical protein [Candidatus Woesearchaeota archaeon]
MSILQNLRNDPERFDISYCVTSNLIYQKAALDSGPDFVTIRCSGGEMSELYEGLKRVVEDYAKENSLIFRGKIPRHGTSPLDRTVEKGMEYFFEGTGHTSIILEIECTGIIGLRGINDGGKYIAKKVARYIANEAGVGIDGLE